ncbi:MAG TPA: hypothetical protein PLZ08_10885 [Bacillota bacterium]|jgi:hypothetical protein|nr:hypothetical protein [Bacillota bacterium]HOL10912.1 hypothetical protein [Bacillota bacterium]HPO98443.1 hypothetical protein [Bacillota bacterium]
MEIEIEYNNSEVTWCYNGKFFNYSREGIEFASVDYNTIYIEIDHDGRYEYQYVNFEGKLLLSYCIATETVTVFNPGPKIIKIPSIQDLAIYNNQRFLVLVGEGDDSRLREYNFQGDLLKEYLSPAGYTFYRLGEIGPEINVVCQGNKLTQDKFGRNDWNFTLDLETGEWKRQSLAY